MPNLDGRSVVVPADKSVLVCANCRFFQTTNDMCRRFHKVDMVTGEIRRNQTPCCQCRDNVELCGRDAKYYEPVDLRFDNINEQLAVVNYMIEKNPSLKTIETSLAVYQLYSSILKIVGTGVIIHQQLN